MSTWTEIKFIRSDEEKLSIDFQNFYELDERKGTYDYRAVNDFYEDLKPIATILLGYNDKQLAHYDNTGYPNKSELYSSKLDGYDFNPIYANYSFAGKKVLDLFLVLGAFLKIAQWEEDKWQMIITE